MHLSYLLKEEDISKINMRKNKVTQKDILYLTGSMFIIVVILVCSNLYHAYATSTISKDLQMQIIPIEGKFDTATIEKIKNRKEVSSNFAANNSPIQASPSAKNVPDFDLLYPSIKSAPITPNPTGAILPTEAPTVTP